MAEKFNFFHHRVMDPKASPTNAGANSGVDGAAGDTGNGVANAGSDDSSKFQPSLKSIVGVGLLMCVIGAFTMNWSEGSGRSRSSSLHSDNTEESAPDPDYLKIKGRRAEDVRSGRGILHSIFCRGNQRSEFCSRR
jgi:hypothetical protein